MKRLLAYLFIVLGLGLTFSVSANAKIVFCELLIKDDGGQILKAGQRGAYGATYDVEPVYFAKDKCYCIGDGGGCKKYHPQISLENYVDKILAYKIRIGKSSVSNYFDVPLNVGRSLIKEFEKNKINTSYLLSVLESRYRVEKKDLPGVNQTQITKAKLSQTKSKEDSSKLLKNLIQLYKDGVLNYSQFEKARKKILQSDDNKITKVEPSQTQKVVKSSDWRSNMQIESTKTDDSSKIARAFPKTDWNEWKKEQGFAPKKKVKVTKREISKSQTENSSRASRVFPKTNWDEWNKEQGFTPKDKKVKIAKKETKQQEFKPKKTNQDNEAPVIQIASTITVDDASYEILGEVSDKSNKIFIRIDGRNIAVKNGKFKVKRFSPVDEQIEIIATDQWGNTSKPKLVNIIIDQKDTIVADLFEALDPSVIKTKTNNDRVALIIGIEKYDQTPEASFANLDAKYFYEYARKGFGVSKSNIKLLVDEDAILVKSLGTLNKWLPGKIKDGKTELIIFFAGHGLASSDGKELYLLPHDSDPDLLARTALSRTELFKEIIALNPKSVTMFLDTCYSGVSRDERTLLASARPVRIVADEQETPNNFTIFSASQLDQISSGLKEAKHGIFSYYLMKGLEGNADSNQDKKITNGELLAYMDENVSQKASELGRQQNPSLAGDPDKVLMSYR